MFYSQYGIVLDAGSSHTSLYISTWPAEKENDTGVVHQIEECKLKGKMKEKGGRETVGHENMRRTYMRTCVASGTHEKKEVG